MFLCFTSLRFSLYRLLVRSFVHCLLLLKACPVQHAKNHVINWIAKTNKKLMTQSARRGSYTKWNIVDAQSADRCPRQEIFLHNTVIPVRVERSLGKWILVWISSPKLWVMLSDENENWKFNFQGHSLDWSKKQELANTYTMCRLAWWCLMHREQFIDSIDRTNSCRMSGLHARRANGRFELRVLFPQRDREN